MKKMSEPEEKSYRVRLTLSGIVEATSEDEARDIAGSELGTFELIDWEVKEIPQR